MYFFLNSEPQLSRLKEFNNQRMRWRRAFRSYFFVTKKTIKKQTCSELNFLETPVQVSRGASTLYFNASFFCNLLLLKNISNPRSRSTKWEINIVLITVLVFQEHPQGYILSFIYKLLRALSLSRMLLSFRSDLYILPQLGKIFKSVVFTFL